MKNLLLRRKGQAAVETAITMPWFVVMVLGIVQLGMLHHARIMTEYAAYNAARAGVVWDGDPKKMKDAALMSVVPSFCGDFQSACRTDTLAGFTATYIALRIEDAFNFPLGSEYVKVTTLAPTQKDFPNGQTEIDFDDPVNRDTTLLSIRVRYLYKLRIPFVNKFIFESWLAGLTGTQVSGGLYPFKKYMGVEDPRARLALEAARAKWDTDACARSGVTLNFIRFNLEAAAQAGKFYLPVTASYTMRMQSNPFKKFAPPANQKACN